MKIIPLVSFGDLDTILYGLPFERCTRLAKRRHHQPGVAPTLKLQAPEQL